MTTVLVGPKTRLARAVAIRALAAGDAVIALARDTADAAAVAALPEYDTASVVDAGSGTAVEELLTGSSGPVRVVVAALGPVHPDAPSTADDAARVTRDLAMLDRVLVMAAQRPVRVVLVSSVIALAPGDDRRYYGGWKALVEQHLQHLVDVRRSAGADVALSVVYPGRLVPPEERRGMRRLHTSYPRAARVVLRTAEGAPRGRALGIDSRFWMAFASISLVARSFRPSTRRPGPHTP